MLPRSEQQILENETVASFTRDWLQILHAQQAIAVKDGTAWTVTVDGVVKHFTDDNTVHEVLGEFLRGVKKVKKMRHLYLTR